MPRHAPAILTLLSALLWTLATTFATASGSDAILCQQATAAAERASGVPDQLLDAISRVESGRYDQSQAAIRAWPWTINAEGQGHFYASKSEAVEAARQFRARGVQSIDVGCTQINLMFHPTAFGSLEDAFDPGRNTTYAAAFLTDLFHQTGSWPHAAAAYHSQTPELGTDYQRKVLEAWADPIDGRNAGASSERKASSRMADFHRQLATLSSAGLTGRIFAGAMPPSAPLSAHPFGRSSLSPSLAGLGRLQRSGGRLFGGGRTLSAYRSMPVAMLTTPPHLVRY